jgi:hypothetical protein
MKIDVSKYLVEIQTEKKKKEEAVGTIEEVSAMHTCVCVSVNV